MNAKQSLCSFLPFFAFIRWTFGFRAKSQRWEAGLVDSLALTGAVSRDDRMFVANVYYKVEILY